MPACVLFTDKKMKNDEEGVVSDGAYAPSDQPFRHFWSGNLAGLRFFRLAFGCRFVKSRIFRRALQPSPCATFTLLLLFLDLLSGVRTRPRIEAGPTLLFGATAVRCHGYPPDLGQATQYSYPVTLTSLWLRQGTCIFYQI